MSLPQPYSSQALLPLSMPTQWPSMLATQPGFAPVPLAPMPAPSVGPSRPAPTSQTAPSTTPRRTLTDDDRWRMCMYHEENPHVKQTEIGAMFGVERSTVSKVLRQKEKYLCPEEGRRSPIKKSRGKFPDIEKALSNWARKHQRQGGELSDAMIKEKALFFANTVGSPDGHQKVLSSSWLEKFRQRNYLTASSSRKASIDTTNLDNAPHTPNVLSPVSPPSATSPLRLSPKQRRGSELRAGSIDGVTDLASNSRSQPLSRNSPLFESKFDPTSSLSQSPVVFSTENPFSPPTQSTSGINSKRARSQTFPILKAEPNSAPTGSPDHSWPPPAATPAIPDEEYKSAKVPSVKRNRSNPEINTQTIEPPCLLESNTISPISSPGSPTQDEARRALGLVLNYFQNQPSGLAMQDFVTIGKLMEKLELVQNQAISQSAALHRIDEHVDYQRVSKKRSIHTL